MPYPTTGNLAPALADLKAVAFECFALRERAKRFLDDIRPALIGQRVRRFGRVYQVCQVGVAGSGDVTCWGVTVSNAGKVGTRGFDLGRLEDCEFLP